MLVDLAMQEAIIRVVTLSVEERMLEALAQMGAMLPMVLGFAIVAPIVHWFWRSTSWEEKQLTILIVVYGAGIMGWGYIILRFLIALEAIAAK